MNLKIEFEKHTGKKKTPLGEVDVDLKQFQIFCTNQDEKDAQRLLVGYVGSQPKAPINLIVNYGEDANKLLKDAITRELELGALQADDARDRSVNVPVDHQDDELPEDFEELETNDEELETS